MKATLRTWTPNIRRAAGRALRWVQRSLIRILIVLAVAITTGGVILSVAFWDWLHAGSQSHSETVRNIGLVHGGGLALAIALWRGWVADREADTARRGLLNERYQQGATMLGSEVLSVRIAGTYALQHLAEEHPEEYHVQIMRLLCAFVRHPVKDEEGVPALDVKGEWSSTSSLREDFQAIMAAIVARHDRQIHFEDQDSAFRFDMRGADLREARLGNVNLPNALMTATDLSWAVLDRAQLNDAALHEAILDGASLVDAKLNRAQLHGAKLSGADLRGADLTEAMLMGSALIGARLRGADLTEAMLMGSALIGADLTGASLTGAILVEADLIDTTGLTQAQLDSARANPENPPKLDGVVDAETGEPLVWRGKPLEDRA